MGTCRNRVKMMKQFLACLLLSLTSQVNCVWSGSGTVQCYSHFETTADFPQGAGYQGPADVTCRPIVWDGASGKGPEAMSFTPDQGDPFDIFAWDYHDGQDSIPYATCNGQMFWYKESDMGGGFCTPNFDAKS